MKPNYGFLIVLMLCFVHSYSVLAQLAPDNIICATQNSKVEFGISHLKKVVNANESDYKIILSKLADKKTVRSIEKLGIQVNAKLQNEGFQIALSEDRNTIAVLALDDAGLMYGTFELAEQIQVGGIEKVSDTFQNPYMKMRGTKFNIPLDVRTPSYSDVSDAGQKNIVEMWNYDFWTEYIDSLARYRYNYISLWSLHPFPSLVKLADYPDVALDDVHQSTINWKENYSLNGHFFTEPEMFENTKVIKKITIDEKIEFWKKVMAYGKQRNVDFYFVTWNIFTYGATGKHGIDDKVDNQTTRDYFRKSVKQMILTYPDLAGIGLTTGENMYGVSTDDKEGWAYDTYGRGVLEASEELPNRKITFIHRQHMAGAREIASKFQPLVDNPNINFIFSFKYAKAHVYSSTVQPYHKGFVKDIQQDADLKTIWTLRNDDIFYHRWGAPDFVRDFIKGIPHHVSDGYYYGSDQYIWGREFMSKNVEGERELELAKHWYHWMMWGRLGYNPEMGNDRFEQILASRFPETGSEQLFEAWQKASMIYPLVTGFHWGSLDFQWYIESGQSRPFYAKTPTGYNDLDFFIELPPHPGTDNIFIPKFVTAKLKNQTLKGITPFELSEQIIKNADDALSWAKSVGNVGGEFGITKNDIQSIAFMGKHYAHKIKAATYLALFRLTYDKTDQQKMLDELRQSTLYWRYYASSSLTINKNPLWTNRVGHVDWRKSYRHVYLEVRSNGGELNIPSMESTPGGTVLEAEAAEFTVAEIAAKNPGFTGTGYLTSRNGHAYVTVNWEYNAPEDGKYLLEFRYSLTRQKHFDSHLKVNGEAIDGLIFWESADSKTWVWDRAKVKLKKGKNTIEVRPEGMVNFDHLNVIKLE